MRSQLLTFAGSLVLVAAFPAAAAALTFDATGDANISGYITFDDNQLTTNIECQPNTAITDMQLTLEAGGATYNFGTGDVDDAWCTIMGNPGSGWIIVNGFGFLATQGDWELSFYPAGTGGSDDGDATMYMDHTSGSPSYRFDPAWVPRAVAPPQSASVQPVPVSSAWSVAMLIAALAMLAVPVLYRRSGGR